VEEWDSGGLRLPESELSQCSWFFVEILFFLKHCTFLPSHPSGASPVAPHPPEILSLRHYLHGSFVSVFIGKNETNVTFFVYYKGKRWRSNGIANVYYRPEERIVTFNLEAFGPVTLIQDTHINMPYQSWELRPLDVNRVLLTVTTVFTELQIQIKVCCCYSESVAIHTGCQNNQ
jgi:hypothetical protein